MAVTIQQVEAKPETYRAVENLTALSDEVGGAGEIVDGVDLRAVWERIETHIAYRYSERDVVWVIEGPGEWHAPLAPAVIETIERWKDGDWNDADDVSPSPYGGVFLPGEGPYRVTATVGGGSPTVPDAVREAIRRLTEYVAAERPRFLRLARANGAVVTWLGHAMAGSGAADLLRPYRRIP
jgi:hypothetical protein